MISRWEIIQTDQNQNERMIRYDLLSKQNSYTEKYIQLKLNQTSKNQNWTRTPWCGFLSSLDHNTHTILHSQF